ncbi:hypothetical protein SAMN05660859_0018 [Ancylobacter rudongensis]|uniref:Uncharacterized protein n=1 Tax=Ancylobacter rudongensis TaxID=177413 RepID=A0A1G4UP31_9HYPH|nr:hypothetical protein SAMN05660859_0018 [Ancylobacter rudongensis]
MRGMTVEEINLMVARLRSSVLATIQNEITQMGHRFDAALFLRHTSADLTQTCAEALFYGAEVFASEEPPRSSLAPSLPRVPQPHRNYDAAPSKSACVCK